MDHWRVASPPFFPLKSPRLSRVSWKDWAVRLEMTSSFSCFLNSWLGETCFSD